MPRITLGTQKALNKWEENKKGGTMKTDDEATFITFPNLS